jgi:hypothetical protein
MLLFSISIYLTTRKTLTFMSLNSFNTTLKKLFDAKCTLEEALTLANDAKKHYNLLLKDPNSPERNIKHPDHKKFTKAKKRFWDEIIPIIHVAEYLKSQGNAPERIIFCSISEEYDGVFRCNDQKEIRLEVTRALGGTEGGEDEGLTQELLDKEGIAPLGQNIDSEGKKNNRRFGENKLKVFKDRHLKQGKSYSFKTVPCENQNLDLCNNLESIQDLENGIEMSLEARLEEAIRNKNNPKRAGYWLIITAPVFGPEDILHEACSRFWSTVRQGLMRKEESETKNKKDPIVFSRVLVIAEEFIKGEDTVSINCDEIEFNLPERIKKRNFEQSIWDSWNDEHKIDFLLKSPNLKFESEDGKELCRLLLNLSDNLLIKNLDSIAEWLKEVSFGKLEQKSEKKFLKLFDNVIQCISQIPVAEKLEDPKRMAFNHPIGDLTEATIQKLRNSNSSKGLPPAIRSRLTILVEKKTNPNYLISLLRLLASVGLNHLYQLDYSKWTKKYILPYFRWSSNNDLTQHIWTIFLWQVSADKRPILTTDLFAEIKQDFIKTIYQLNSKEEESFWYIFIYLYFSRDGYFTESDLSRDRLENLPIEKLEFISFAVFQVLDVEGKNSQNLWNNKIDPWIKASWPQGEQFITTKISDNFIRAAMAAGGAFGEAIKTLSLKGMLIPVSLPSLLYIVQRFDLNISAFFPEESLEMWYKILPKEIIENDLSSENLYSIREYLDKLVVSHPSFVKDSRYIELKQSIEITLKEKTKKEAKFSKMIDQIIKSSSNTSKSQKHKA